MSRNSRVAFAAFKPLSAPDVPEEEERKVKSSSSAIKTIEIKWDSAFVRGEMF